MIRGICIVPYLCLVLLWTCCNVAMGYENGHSPHDGGIHWSDLSVVHQEETSDVEEEKYILHESTGSVLSGHLCGILGPSGAGKSTFLTAIAGTTSKHSALKVSGGVWMEDSNGRKSNLSIRKGEVAFLQQHDIFFSMLSSRETLDLAAFLELPPRSSKQERDALVDKSLVGLGLAGVQHRKIGDRALSKQGLSGGERRRLSVALELISSPRLFLADEPTTGLDSTQAQKVVNLMHRLARERNIPCLLSLHQPRASIWKQLDSFILLAPGGRVCYMGSRKDATKYFSKLGYKCPSETNPAEYFIDLVSIDTEDAIQEEKDNQRIDDLAEAFALHTAMKQQGATQEEAPAVVETNVATDTASTTSRPFLSLRRLGALLLRSWRQNIRNNRVNLLRLGTSIGQALLLSQIFKTVQKGLPTAFSVADRTALLSFGAINMSMMALTKTLDLFSKEKGVVIREQTRKQYSSWEYLLSKAIAELPLDTCFSAVFALALKATTGLRIPLLQLMGTFSLMTVAGASLGFAIGSITHSAESAMATGVPYLVILMCVGIINPSGIDKTKPPPEFIRYLKAISPIRWAIEALCIGEYTGMVFDGSNKRRFPWQKLRDLPKMGAFVMVRDGGQVLNALGLEDAKYSDRMLNLAKLSGVHLLVSWLGLHYGGPQFVEATTDAVPAFKDGLKSQTVAQKDPLKVPVIRNM